MYDTTSRIERGVICGPPRRSQFPWPWPWPSSYGVRHHLAGASRERQCRSVDVNGTPLARARRPTATPARSVSRPTRAIWLSRLLAAVAISF